MAFAITNVHSIGSAPAWTILQSPLYGMLLILWLKITHHTDIIICQCLSDERRHSCPYLFYLKYIAGTLSMYLQIVVLVGTHDASVRILQL